MGDPIDFKQMGAFKSAIEAVGQVTLWPDQYSAFVQALASFIGGPPESVDAFVTRVAVTGGMPEQIFVLWLRG
jgi:hypothetical protein